MAHLVVEHRTDPAARRRFKQLPSNHHPASSDVARREDPFLRAHRPRNRIAVEFRQFGEEFGAQVAPHGMQKLITRIDADPSRLSRFGKEELYVAKDRDAAHG